MTDKKIIISGIVIVLLLATVGYFMVNPIDFKSLSLVKKDVYEEENENKKENEKNESNYETQKYQITFSTSESENENEYCIKFDIKYEKNNIDCDYSNVLNFNKEDGTLLNEDLLDTIDDEEIKNITNQIVTKIQNEKLYKINSLNMSYYSSSKTNIK